MSKFTTALFHAKNFVALKGGNDFADHLRVMHETNYDLKLRFEPPWPRASTTFGPRYVRITQRFLDWNTIKQAGHLIHEATHCMQYDRYGGAIGFYQAYLVMKKEMEAEAESWQRKFLQSL